MNFQTELLQTFEINEQILTKASTEEEMFLAFRALLIQRIEELIQRDFEKLKWILYRIDVSEKKLSEALKNSEGDAATIIADMIIKRQMEKAESRKIFGEPTNDWDFDL